MPSRRAASIALAAALAACVGRGSAEADCYQWPLRGDLAYDGDTVLLTLPALPAELREVSARLLNIDAPELKAACDAEKALAERARDTLRALLANAGEVVICPIKWDKYGGRFDAMVWADGVDVGERLVEMGLARPYGGGQRESWCP